MAVAKLSRRISRDSSCEAFACSNSMTVADKMHLRTADDLRLEVFSDEELRRRRVEADRTAKILADLSYK